MTASSPAGPPRIRPTERAQPSLQLRCKSANSCGKPEFIRCIAVVHARWIKMDVTDDAKENAQMLPRSTLMNDKLPTDRQIIEVRLGNTEWQPATFRDGEFLDLYGMTIDRRRISSWRPAKAAAVNHP